jgi:acetyltransferase
MFSNVSSGFHPKVERVLRDGSVPYLQGTRETLKALQAFARYAEDRRLLSSEKAAVADSPEDMAIWRQRLLASRGGLTEIQARELLTAYGIPGPREGTAATADAAVDLAQTIGYPVVLKILSPDIQHKTEIRGIRVGLADDAAVTNAFREVMTAARRHSPGARLQGVLVQEMISADAVEVILGLGRDPAFGPVVVFGSGGILVELMKDSVSRVPPLSRAQALEMIHETRGARLLEGFRGRPKADIGALAGALVSLSHLALDVGDLVRALDINPLMVLPDGQGVRAVDALVELG